jgi:hypothetical protein
MVAAPDGSTVLKHRAVEPIGVSHEHGLPVEDYVERLLGPAVAPEKLGRQVADQLRAAGADRLLSPDS